MGTGYFWRLVRVSVYPLSENPLFGGGICAAVGDSGSKLGGSGGFHPFRALRMRYRRWRRADRDDGRPPFVHRHWDDRIIVLAIDARQREDLITWHVPSDIPSECLYYADDGQLRAAILTHYDRPEERLHDRWRMAGGWLDMRSKDGRDERWVDLEEDGQWVYIPPAYIHRGAASTTSIALIEKGTPLEFMGNVLNMRAIDADLTRIHPRQFAMDAELWEYQRQIRPKSMVEEHESARGMIYMVIAAILGAIVLLGIVLLGSQPAGGGSVAVAPAPTVQPVEPSGEITLPQHLQSGEDEIDDEAASDE